MIAVVEDDHPRAGNRACFPVKALRPSRAVTRAIFDRLLNQCLSGLRSVLSSRCRGEDGLSICRRLFNGPSDTPVLMVTAKGDDVE